MNTSVIRVMRVLKEDKDFITAEIPKRDDVSMNIGDIAGEAQDARFYTFVYLHQIDGKMVTWDPFE